MAAKAARNCSRRLNVDHVRVTHEAHTRIYDAVMARKSDTDRPKVRLSGRRCRSPSRKKKPEADKAASGVSQSLRGSQKR